jgi:acyl dehydratase
LKLRAFATRQWLFVGASVRVLHDDSMYVSNCCHRGVVMPLDASIVGSEIGNVRAACEARWLMAYAAGVPDERRELFDTTTTLVAHPMFPVAPEWGLLVSHWATAPSLSSTEALRALHVAHDVILERPICPGETVDIRARVIAVGRRSGGATQNVLFEATDREGSPVWRTNHTSLFRGVELLDDPVHIDVDWPDISVSAAGSDSVIERSSRVGFLDAHVYTECARIWNPIHTDLAVARSAGLDGPILHGTATLARGVSIVTEIAGWSLAEVGRVAGAFTAMIHLDTTMNVRALHVSATVIHFEVIAQSGSPAITHGLVTKRTS